LNRIVGCLVAFEVVKRVLFELPGQFGKSLRVIEQFTGRSVDGIAAWWQLGQDSAGVLGQGKRRLFRVSGAGLVQAVAMVASRNAH
jgi:hypothetical protein